MIHVDVVTSTYHYTCLPYKTHFWPHIMRARVVAATVAQVRQTTQLCLSCKQSL